MWNLEESETELLIETIDTIVIVHTNRDSTDLSIKSSSTKNTGLTYPPPDKNRTKSRAELLSVGF